MTDPLELAEWLDTLAAAGGKGVVNTIDARSLGRCATAIRDAHARIAELRAEIGRLQRDHEFEAWADKCQRERDVALKQVGTLRAERDHMHERMMRTDAKLVEILVTLEELAR